MLARRKRGGMGIDEPAGREGQARDGRHGADDETGHLPPLPRGPAPIVPYPIALAAPVAPPAFQDDLDVADGPEGTLDLRE